MTAGWRRVGTGAAAGCLLAITTVSAAAADAAEPTDFRTEIVSVTPADAPVSVSIAGGDSFVVLAAEPGVTVDIAGYRGEPYLRFEPDGRVLENRVAPTTAANRDRYGQEPAAATDVDPAAGAPDWSVVATDGRYAWHDHRAHWMVPDPPTGAARGEVFERSVLDLVVDGGSVQVAFEYRWVAAPSRVAGAAGAVVAVFVALIVVSVRRPVALAVALGAASAAAVGWWQFRSFPASADPLVTWYLVPAIAAAAAAAGTVLRRSLIGKAALLLAGMLLAVWVFLRRDGFTQPVLPTDAPFWLDRGVTAAAGVLAAVAVLVGASSMFHLPSPSQPDDPSPSGRRGERRSSVAAAPSTAATTTWGPRRR